MDYYSLVLVMTVCGALVLALVGIAGAIIETEDDFWGILLDLAAMFSPLSINIFVFGAGFVVHGTFGLPAYMGIIAGALTLGGLSFVVVPKIKRKYIGLRHKEK